MYKSGLLGLLLDMIKHHNPKKCVTQNIHSWTDLIKLHSELSSTLQRGGESVDVLPPESKEFLDAQAAQSVVPCVTYAVLLTHWHHLVVHVQSILGRVEENDNVSIFLPITKWKDEQIMIVCELTPRLVCRAWSPVPLCESYSSLWSRWRSPHSSPVNTQTHTVCSCQETLHYWE